MASSPPPPTTPRLTKAVSGSGFQFMCATLPFLALFIYFLYLAAIRPSLAIYQDYDQAAAAADTTGAIIPLMDMMGCFLAFLGLFSMLAVYMSIFVTKRQQLMKSYLEPTAESTLGDVFYDGTPHRYGSFTKFGYVMYNHPVKKKYLVRKRVRCYQQYTRERVTILLLPSYPFSGQPKTDVEMDLAASEDSRKDTTKVLYCLVFWILFLLAAPIYLLHQMSLIEDDYDDPKRGWIIYLVVVGGIIPLVAFGGNYVRWRLHRHWVVNRGAVIELKKSADGSEEQVRIFFTDCGTLDCMRYDRMPDDANENKPTITSPLASTVVSEKTANNSVYMA